MWEDVVWERSTKQTEAEKTEVTKDIEQESKMKPKLKPKPKLEAKMEDGRGGDENGRRSEAKMLSEPQLAKIKKRIRGLGQDCREGRRATCRNLRSDL